MRCTLWLLLHGVLQNKPLKGSAESFLDKVPPKTDSEYHSLIPSTSYPEQYPLQHRLATDRNQGFRQLGMTHPGSHTGR